MPLLNQDQIYRLHHAAIKAGLANNREALLGGIDRHIAVAIHHASSLNEQLLIDLQTLAEIEYARDRSIPVDIWLNNAEHLARGRVEAEIFGTIRPKRPGRPKLTPVPPTRPPMSSRPAQSSPQPVTWTPLPGSSLGATIAMAAGLRSNHPFRLIVAYGAVLAACVIAIVGWPAIAQEPSTLPGRAPGSRPTPASSVKPTVSPQQRSPDGACAVQLLTIDWENVPRTWTHGGARNSLRSLAMPIEYFETTEDKYRVLWAVTLIERADELRREAAARLAHRVGESQCDPDFVDRVRAGRALPR